MKTAAVHDPQESRLTFNKLKTEVSQTRKNNPKTHSLWQTHTIPSSLSFLWRKRVRTGLFRSHLSVCVWLHYTDSWIFLLQVPLEAHSNSHWGSAWAITFEHSFVLHNLLIYFHIWLHIFSRTSQGTNPLFFPLATQMKPLLSSSLLTQIWKYKWRFMMIQMCYQSVRFKCTLNVLTCPSFRVIWPCSLQPIKVRLHLNTLSPAFTCCAYDAGKKPILSSITPWKW